METIKLDIPIKPFGKQRPRVISKGGKSWSFTPKQTINYEKLVKETFIEKFNDTYKDYENAISIDIIFYTHSDKVKIETINNKKPDIDNLFKAILDSLNGVAYKDDKQIYQIVATKYLTNKEDLIKITINYL